ncbi:MAG: multicopper oxidase domain-containing protein, partial [Pseudomonadota bacterium]
TYFYRVNSPGTFMYHCHQEATEHMQMGMLGNLYVRPRQNRLPDGTVLGSHVHRNPDNTSGTVKRSQDDPVVGDKYVYNDGDGKTRYDVEYPIQLAGFDSSFHEASVSTQPLPFALMRDDYPLINGRGYPDTVNPDPIANEEGKLSQRQSALIKAAQGQRILLRLSSLDVTRYFTVSAGGLPMTVVGRGAAILRGHGRPEGKDLSYTTGSVNLGGGEAVDVIIDTTGIPRGTYALHAANLHYLANAGEDLGGMMTEIVIE